jgi:hypothetical protein
MLLDLQHLRLKKQTTHTVVNFIIWSKLFKVFQKIYKFLLPAIQSVYLFNVIIRLLLSDIAFSKVIA